MAEDRKLDELEYDEDMLDDIDMEEENDNESLFWSLKVPTKEAVDIAEPTIPGYIIHVTKACFGPQVSKNSRSVVMCNNAEDPENPEFSFGFCFLFFVSFTLLSVQNLYVLLRFIFDIA